MIVRRQDLMGFWCLIFLLALLASPFSAFSADSLVIEVNEGGVKLEADPDALTEDQRETLMNWVNEAVEEFPAFTLNGGRLTLKMGKDKLPELKAALDRVGAGKDAELEDLFRTVSDEGDGETERVFIGRDFRVEQGEAVDKLVVIGSRGTVEGSVGTLVLIGSHMAVTSTGRVSEQLVSVGSRLDKEPGASVSSEEVNISLPGSVSFWQNMAEDWADAEWGDWSWVGSLANWVSGILLGLLYLLLFAGFSGGNRAFLERRWPAALGYGILGAMAVVPAVVVLVLTILGIFLVPLYIVAVALLWLLGQVEVATCLGDRLLREKSPHLVVTFLVGFILIRLVDWIPWVGTPLVFLATLAGFGSILVGLYRQWKPQPV